MKKFFFLLLFLSITAMAGTYVWKTWFPEAHGTHMTDREIASEKSSRFAARKHLRAQADKRRPSRRQDKIFDLAAFSSLFSMLGTLLSLFFAYRADRRSARSAHKE